MAPATFARNLAAFAVVATIATEFVMLRGEINAGSARTLRIVDAAYGASASALLLNAQQLRTVRRLVHWELAAIVGILLCAVLMARGIGFIS
jgi:uncharacterized membrane protein